MITTKKHKVIIEIKHPCPAEFGKDLKEAIIGVLQNQAVEFQSPQDTFFRTHTLLELLKNLEK